MINSFLDLVKESQEVDEMGIANLKKLTNSSLGKVGSFAETLRKLISLLKDVKSTEIIMVKPDQSREYYPTFTNPEIISTMQALKQENSRKYTDVIGQWYDIDRTGVHMKTDGPSDFQRSHFPDNGIKPALRGIGLGKKLYRALARTVGYISSNTSGTNEKDNVWASIVQTKRNPDGTLSEEDVYSIVGASSWIIFDKSMNANEIVRIAIKFLDERISFSNTTPTQFDMDDQLFAMLPDDVLSSFDRTYLDGLVRDGRISQEKKESIINSHTRAEALARERADREAAAAREIAAREEAEIRNRSAARISRYGVNPDADWDVGDFIVVKQYLYSGWEPLPIREVAGFYNNQYYALNIKQMIKVKNNEITFHQATDNRTTRDKSEWLKVELDRIPDLDNVNFSDSEKAYIRTKLSPETITNLDQEQERRRQERAHAESEENTDRLNDLSTFGFVPTSGQDLKQALLARATVDNANLLKRFKSQAFYSQNAYIVMGQPQITALRQNFGIPVFIPWIGHHNNPRPASLDDIRNGRARLTNAVTGVHLLGPYGGLNLFAYPLSDVTVADKLGARAGEHFFIAGHQNAYGIIAKSEYGAVNTNNQKFIYLKVYGYAGRSVSVRLDLLKKLGAPINI